MATTKSDYIFALLREIEQRFPSSGITNHAITWDSVDGTGEVLVLLVNVGDCMWPHRINPRDLSDDPAVQRLGWCRSLRTGSAWSRRSSSHSSAEKGRL